VKAEGDFTDHLEELRCRILVVLAFFLAAFLQAPLEGLGLSLYYFKPYEKFLTYMKLSFWGGLILSLPLAIVQAALFIYPPLRREEIRFFAIWCG
jgi:sec-independent protein translocase protein TatC